MISSTASKPIAPVALDVAIVGAGPAGGAAALELARTGWRVAVIEKAVPPRYKTCGGGLLWRARQRLPADIGDVVEHECRQAELVHHGPSLRFVTRRPHPIVSMVMRDRFDHALLQAAQARGALAVHTATAVHTVRRAPEAVQLDCGEVTFSARFVIAADGVNSVVARSLGLPPLQDVVPAFECEAEFDEAVLAPWRGTARFDFGLVPAGYGWVFPKAGHLSIGVGTTVRGAANLPEQYRSYLTALGLPAPLREQRHGFMIPCRPRRQLFREPRVLFVGDAAGLADPVTAEGIGAGIVSGQLAARALIAADLDVTAVQASYRRTLSNELLADLRVARVLAWLLYHRPRWCAALLARHGAGMIELMTRIVCGETTYRQAIRAPGHYLHLLRGRRTPAARAEG